MKQIISVKDKNTKIGTRKLEILNSSISNKEVKLMIKNL